MLNDKISKFIAVVGAGLLSYIAYDSLKDEEISYHVDHIITKKYKRTNYYIPDKNTYHYKVKLTDNNKTIVNCGMIIDGKREGVWQRKVNNYDEFATYKNDKLNGKTTLFDNDKLLSIRNYEDDIIMSQYLYNKKGNCINLPDGEIFVWIPGLYCAPDSNQLINVYIKLRVTPEMSRVTPFYDILDYNMVGKGRIQSGYVEEIIDGYDSKTSYDSVTLKCEDTEPHVYKLGDLIKSDSYDGRPYIIDSYDTNYYGINANLYMEDCIVNKH